MQQMADGLLTQEMGYDSARKKDANIVVVEGTEGSEL